MSYSLVNHDYSYFARSHLILDRMSEREAVEQWLKQPTKKNVLCVVIAKNYNQLMVYLYFWLAVFVLDFEVVLFHSLY